MAKKIAIDWDESELRLVSAQCSGANVKVTEAALIPIQDGNVLETLRDAITERSLTRTDTLVAIGRGKAELRELQLPPVPEDELPDMVRLQAIRSFASAGDSATVDFLVTNKSDSGTSLIAAAVGPAKLSEIHEVCESGDLNVKRIALRPLAAAALYLAKSAAPPTSGETVLIDQLDDDAEIVVVRNGKVVFVRTVRMPTVAAARSTALAGELRRSLVACGASGSPDKVVIWGQESVHHEEAQKISEATGGVVEILDPFELVDVDKKCADSLPEHVGRLAPLVGLLANDESGGDRLIDFLNPRERPEEESQTFKKALMIGVPVAAALLLSFFVYKKLNGLTREIADLTEQKNAMEEDVKIANAHRDKTRSMDKFLDGDVNWLNEIRRMSSSMPPAEKLILKSINGNINPRDGSATLTVSGAVTEPAVIDEFEDALRDDNHGVSGPGTKDAKSKDRYRWTLKEDISINPGYVSSLRYGAIGPRARMAKATEESAGDAAPIEKNKAEGEDETPVLESVSTPTSSKEVAS